MHPHAYTELEPHQLHRRAVVAQCLDNHWVPRPLLAAMLRDRTSLAQVRDGLRVEARRELLRALLCTEQVVVNRAFLLNNPVLYSEYQHAGASQDAFRALLENQAIVPFLLDGRTVDAPAAYDVVHDGLDAWSAMSAGTTYSCVRLSWHENDNAAAAERRLHAPFRDWVAVLGAVPDTTLQRDFPALGQQARGELLERLADVAAWAAVNPATRNALYERFVTRTAPVEGAYDQDKPFAGEVKQLIDLMYNANLADALGCRLLSPARSLDRLGAPELRARPGHAVVSVPLDDFIDLLRRFAFEQALQPLDITFGSLELEHVIQVRATSQWRAYQAALAQLVDEPQGFAGHAPRVYTAYIEMARALAGVVGARRDHLKGRVGQVVNVTVEVVGAVIGVVFDPGGGTTWEILRHLATPAARKASRAVVHLGVVSRDHRSTQRQLDARVRIMEIEFNDVVRDWATLVTELTEAFDGPAQSGPDDEHPTIDPPEEVP